MRGNILRRLGELVGPEQVSDDGVSPGTAEQVAAILELANAERLRVVPAGNFSQRAYSLPSPEADFFLRLDRLNRVKHYEPGDLTASLEAGITVAGLDEALGKNRQWLPLGVPHPGRATLGGVLASNAGGPFRLFYGAARDVVIGMRFATVEGKLVKSGGNVVKNVAGYDMSKLLIGSWGTLAVITDVNVKVFPRPATETTLLGFGSLAQALEARSAMLRSVLAPLALDLLDAGAAALAGSNPERSAPGWPAPKQPFLLAAAYGGVEAVIERSRREVAAVGESAGAAAAVTLAGGDEQDFWSAVCDLPATAAAADSASVRLKLSSTLTAMRPLLEGLLAPLPAGSGDTETALVARAGSGISYLYAQGRNLLAFCRRAQESAQAQGAFAVIEFAPREIREQLDVWGPRRDDFPVMQKLKQVFDPNAVLNPGRFVC